MARGGAGWLPFLLRRPLGAGAQGPAQGGVGWAARRVCLYACLHESACGLHAYSRVCWMFVSPHCLVRCAHLHAVC
jgi:hypothetical protein